MTLGVPADGAGPRHAITLRLLGPAQAVDHWPTQDSVSETRSMLCRLIVIHCLPRPSASVARVHASHRVADHEAACARWFAFALLDVIVELSSQIPQLPVLR